MSVYTKWLKSLVADTLALPLLVCGTRCCRRDQRCLGFCTPDGEFRCVSRLTPEQRAVYDALHVQIVAAMANIEEWLRF